MQKNPLPIKTRLAKTNGEGVHNFTNLLSDRLTGVNAVLTGLHSTVILQE